MLLEFACLTKRSSIYVCFSHFQAHGTLHSMHTRIVSNMRLIAQYAHAYQVQQHVVSFTVFAILATSSNFIANTITMVFTIIPVYRPTKGHQKVSGMLTMPLMDRRLGWARPCPQQHHSEPQGPPFSKSVDWPLEHTTQLSHGQDVHNSFVAVLPYC